MVLVGDVHGKTVALEQIVQSASGKLVFQIGDMGLGFSGVTLSEEYSHDRFRFIRGNHDSPRACKDHPNYAGEFGYLFEQELFFLGGAWSIDQAYRVEGVSWWRDEEQSIEALNAALNLYLDVKPRFVVTHEAPSCAAYNTISNVIFPPTPKNLITVPHDEKYREYKKAVGFADTRTSQALQQMFESHEPELWVFGHYHVNREFQIGHTKFRCLAELSMMEIG